MQWRLKRILSHHVRVWVCVCIMYAPLSAKELRFRDEKKPSIWSTLLWFLLSLAQPSPSSGWAMSIESDFNKKIFTEQRRKFIRFNRSISQPTSNGIDVCKYNCKFDWKKNIRLTDIVIDEYKNSKKILILVAKTIQKFKVQSYHS